MSCSYIIFLLALYFTPSITASVRIFTNGGGDTAKAVGSTSSLCGSSGVTLLSSSSSNCFRSITSQGTAIVTTCPSQLANANAVSCVPGICFASSPSTPAIYVLNATSGAIIDSFGSGTLINPSSVVATTNASPYSVIVGDFDGSKIIVYRYIWTTVATVSSSVLAQITSSTAAAGIILTNTTAFAIASISSTTLRIYNFTGTLLGSFGSFGSISHISADFYGQIYVYDTSCSCVQVLNKAGTTAAVIDTWAIPSVVTISHARDFHYVVDNLGVLKYYYGLTLQSYNGSNTTCPSSGGFMSAYINGGASPYTYSISPLYQIKKTISATSNTVTGIAAPVFSVKNFSVYADMTLLPPFTVSTTLAVDPASTAIPPRSGTSSYQIMPASNGYTNFVSTSMMNANFWAGLELYVNPGIGGQNFTITLDSLAVFKQTFLAGDLPINTWTRVYIDFSNSASSLTFSNININDISGASTVSNPLYLDDITMLPYPSYNPVISVVDFCNASVSTPPMSFNINNVLTPNLVITPTSCNAGSSDGAKGFDGMLTINATGGVAPYSYSWSFSNSTTNTVTGLGAMRSNIYLYQNELNSTWIDYTIATYSNFQDTTYYHSAPYSISFVSSKNLERIKFAIDGGITMPVSKYSAFEFWVNGGPVGGQILSAVVLIGASYVGSMTPVNTLANIPGIPANTWIKITVPIPSTPVGAVFDGILVGGIGNVLQPILYFDDFMLISRDLTVTVSDSAGCNATITRVYMTSPQLISSAVSTQSVKCNGGSDGSVSLAVTGGTQPYQYAWSVSAPNSSNTATGLPQSVLYAMVTDSKGCHAPTPVSVVIAQPPVLTYAATLQPPQCHGNLGTITATTIGGNGPYTYKWQSATPTSNFTIKLQPNPSPVFIDAFANRFTSVGSPNASTVCVGVDYSWNSAGFPVSHAGYCSLLGLPSTSNTTANTTKNGTTFGAPKSFSTVLALGCSQCIDTTKYSGMELWIAIDAALLPNMSLWLVRGSLTIGSTLYLTNNTANFTAGFYWQKIRFYFDHVISTRADFVVLMSAVPWDLVLVDDVVLIPSSKSTTLVTGNGVNTGFNSIISVIAGVYTLNLTDGNSCPNMVSFNITQPDALDIQAVLTDGAADITVTGGVPPYKYYWSNGLQTASVKLPGGSYSFMVVDANGCSWNKTIDIKVAATSQTALLAGVITGVSVAVLGAVGFVLARVWRRQRVAVQGLLEAAEGERRAYKIDFTALEVGSVIGAGSFGEVFRGEYKGTDVAIKKLKSQQMSKKQIDEFAKESAVMVGLRHPNILLFMGVCLEPERLCIVTEMMPRGDLCEILKNKDINIPTPLLYKMAVDTLKGLQFIHSSGFVHRDLKSPNLLVDKNWNIKIADFGLSCAQVHANVDAQVSLLWTAPEILMREKDCYSFKSDMFSFGVILWELMSKKIPWEGIAPASITSKVVAGLRPPMGEEWDTNIVALIYTSWAQDPEARPDVKQARAIFETDIMPTVSGEFQSMSYGSNYEMTSSASNSLRAPPPQPPFAYVVVNVGNSTELWEQDPRGMSHAVDMIASTLSKFSDKLSGFEISTDTHFQYAFANPVNAINFCLRTLLAMKTSPYRESLLALPGVQTETNDDGEVIHRGPRLFMGVSWCSPMLRKDPETGHPTYAGAAVSTAQVISRLGSADSIMLDEEMYRHLMVPAAVLELEAFAMRSVGTKQFAGKEEQLYKVVTAGQKDALDEIDEDGASTSLYSKEPWLVDFEDIKLGKVIGTGTFGDVFAGSYKSQPVAVKKFVRTKLGGQVMMEMRTECAILRSLQHPNILQFIGMCLKSPNLCLLTEIMDRGSLATVLSSSIELPWARRISMAKDIALGMAYLHANDIIHRDIKSTNMLVGSDWTIKIADFGFSRIRVVNQTMTQCGTVAWTAPEIFESSHYTNKADVFSYAVVLWELIFRAKPWQGKHSMKIISTVEHGGRLPINNMPNDTPLILKAVMISCWDQTPESRPTFEKVFADLSSI